MRAAIVVVAIAGVAGVAGCESWSAPDPGDVTMTVVATSTAMDGWSMNYPRSTTAGATRSPAGATTRS